MFIIPPSKISIIAFLPVQLGKVVYFSPFYKAGKKIRVNLPALIDLFRLEFSTLKTRTKTGAELTFTNTSRDHYWERATELPQNSENKPRGLYFSKALFEGLTFGVAYIRRGLSKEGNLHFQNRLG